jgi:hypothetical protein
MKPPVTTAARWDPSEDKETDRQFQSLFLGVQLVPVFQEVYGRPFAAAATIVAPFGEQVIDPQFAAGTPSLSVQAIPESVEV